MKLFLLWALRQLALIVFALVESAHESFTEFKRSRKQAMTVSRFNLLCQKYGVAPDLALESDSIHVALHNRDDAEVERILREEF